MKNLKEFKELILKYESITLEDIIATEDNIKGTFDEVAQALTGFGYRPTCTLCQIVKGDCEFCTWSYIVDSSDLKYFAPCTILESKITYIAIYKAETPEELLKAFKARAKYMRQCLTNIKKTI